MTIQTLKDQYKTNSNPANKMKDSWNLRMAKQLDAPGESKKETSTLRRPEVMQKKLSKTRFLSPNLNLEKFKFFPKTSKQQVFGLKKVLTERLNN